jgi:hypothetical protein
MQPMLVFAVLLFVVIGLYTWGIKEGHNPYSPTEGFTDSPGNGSAVLVEPVATDPEIAELTAGPFLGDMLTVKTGLTSYDSQSCAGVDGARQLELGGQYVQRTNNYARTYPDNCSAPRSDFVGSVYSPPAIGQTVPCNGTC